MVQSSLYGIRPDHAREKLTMTAMLCGIPLDETVTN